MCYSYQYSKLVACELSLDSVHSIMPHPCTQIHDTVIDPQGLSLVA